MSRHPVGREHHDRRPLLRRHVPTMRVLSQDVPHQFQSFREGSRLRFKLQELARLIPMPPVYNFVADQIDRLELSLLSNIMDQGLERFSIHVTTEGRKTVAGEYLIGHFFFRFGFAKCSSRRRAHPA